MTERKARLQEIVKNVYPELTYSMKVCAIVAQLAWYRAQLMEIEMEENALHLVELPLEKLEDRLLAWQPLAVKKFLSREESKRTAFEKYFADQGCGSDAIVVRTMNGLQPGEHVGFNLSNMFVTPFLYQLANDIVGFRPV